MEIIELLEKEARKFMEKSLNLEEGIQRDIVGILNRTRENIKLVLESSSDVNIGTLESLINTRIRPLIDQMVVDMQEVIDNAIENQYIVGFDNGGRLLEIADDTLNPLNYEENMDEELLYALILFGRRLIRSFGDDLISTIHKNATNIYIESKDRNNESSISTTLSSAVIARYIIPTFKNYRHRAQTITQTEVIRAINHGHMTRYRLAREIERNLMVRWVYIRARNTCQQCIEMGNGGEIGRGVYHINSISPPPLHPNCRCILIPWYIEW